ncbi:MAG: 3-oxoacyl-[acyl-carrier-protein] synthase [Mycobacterium sp.]|nr:3-oxoacyl-[acyl-carrier-protein] synthase [Mycobacterium sp.]
MSASEVAVSTPRVAALLPTVSLLDVSTYLPGEPVSADYYAQFADSDDLRDNLMFRAPRLRHHVAPDETAIDMVERAAAGLVDRHGADMLGSVDVLITHTQLPDMPFYGGGGGMAHRLNMKPHWVIDLHNGGCAAFVLGLKLARNLLSSGEGRTALVAVAQNSAGQIFDQETVRRKAQASVPGDGAAVGLVAVSDESPILDVECRTYGEYAGDMTIAMDPPRKWWQAGPGEGCIGFTESRITKVLARGNRQVPEVAYAVCDRIGVAPKDIDMLVTNQPNRAFLRNWREALELPTERHVDTFDECGNLFAAGIPVNLDRAISGGRVANGDVVMMAAFAHAGDFAGAAAVKWGGRTA